MAGSFTFFIYHKMMLTGRKKIYYNGQTREVRIL